MNTKDKIINTATGLLFEKDYDSISLNLIAKKIGIKKPSIYYYFNSKESLYEEAIDQLIFSINKEFDKIIESDIKVEDKIEKFIYTFLSLGYTKKDNFKNLLTEGIYKNKRIYKFIHARNDILKKLEKLLCGYKNKKDLALSLLGSAGALMAEEVINKKEVTDKDLKKITKKVILILLK